MVINRPQPIRVSDVRNMYRQAAESEMHRILNNPIADEDDYLKYYFLSRAAYNNNFQIPRFTNNRPGSSLTGPLITDPYDGLNIAFANRYNSILREFNNNPIIKMRIKKAVNNSSNISLSKYLSMINRINNSSRVGSPSLSNNNNNNNNNNNRSSSVGNVNSGNQGSFNSRSSSMTSTRQSNYNSNSNIGTANGRSTTKRQRIN